MKKNARASSLASRIMLILLILFLALDTTGCAGLRKKFVRKKKVEEKKPHYYRIEKYDTHPTLELYTKHYVYWRSWHREIIELLGENIKKDKRCIDEMIGNLQDMMIMLVDEKGDELEKHIEALRGIKKEIDRRDLTLATKTRVRRVLEKEFMLIKIDFSYRKMAPYIRSEFRKS